MKDSKIVQEIAQGVIDYLKKRKLNNLLPEVINYLKREEVGSVAWVYTPRRLEPDEKAEVNKLFMKLAGEVPEKVNYGEDSRLIDGLILSYKDKLWDFSLQNQVSHLTKG